jgi:hypothetical protein
MSVEIQVRRGTAAAWTTANTVLGAGEWGFETDTYKLKIGNGATAWTSLAYLGAGSLSAANNLSDLSALGTARLNLGSPDLPAVQAASTINASLTSPGATFDGFTLTNSGTDQVLLTGQTTGSQNGPWVWNGATSALTRPLDLPSGSVVRGRTVLVVNGSVFAGTIWTLSAASTGLTVDTTTQTWAPANSAYFSSLFVLASSLTSYNSVVYGTGAPSNTAGENGDGYLDYSTGLFWGPKASGAWPGSASDLASSFIGVGDPRNQGLIGWTLVPEAAGTTLTPTTNVIVLARCTALTNGTVGHIGYGISGAGTSLTTGNMVGIYDTGQTTAATFTLLGTSADQSSTWTSTGIYSTALTSGVAVVAGRDYMLAFQTISSGTAPHLYGGANQANGQGLTNIGLTANTTSMRVTKATGGTTALPATIAASATSTQQQAPFMTMAT